MEGERSRRQSKRTQSTKWEFGYCVGIGIGITVIISVALLSLISHLILKGSISEEKSGIYIVVTRIISVLLGSLMGARISNKKPLPIMMTISGGYLFLLLCVAIVVYDGAFKNVLVGIMSIFAGCAIACMIKLKTQNKRRHTARRIK